MNVKRYIENEWNDTHGKKKYLYAPNSIKNTIRDDPMLFVGIGGSGVAEVSVLKNKIEKLYHPDVVSKLEYLVIDTDELGKNANFSKGDVLIIQNSDIAMLLREWKAENNFLPEEIREWLDERLSPFNVMNGAAGIRQAGRLILFLNAQKIYKVIKKKIEKICCDYDLKEKRVQVYIFAGIGGGTGSGMFVDISYLVRAICDNAEINGVLFMPDVSCMKPGLRDVTKNNIMRNGFAALKELDYLMMLDRYEECFEQKYPGDIGLVKESRPIFDYCILVGAQETGRRAVWSEQEIYHRTAEYMLTEIQGKIEDEHGVESFKSNLVVPSVAKNAFFERYVSIGAKAEYIAVDYYYSWWLSDVFNKLYEVVNSHSDMEKMLQNRIQKFTEKVDGWLQMVASEQEVYKKVWWRRRKIIKNIVMPHIKSLVEEDKKNGETLEDSWEVHDYRIKNKDFGLKLEEGLGEWRDKYKDNKRHRNRAISFEYASRKKLVPFLKNEVLCGLEEISDEEIIFEQIIESIQNECKKYKEIELDSIYLGGKEDFDNQREKESYQKSVMGAVECVLQDFVKNRSRWLGKTEPNDKFIWLSDYIAKLLENQFYSSGCTEIDFLLKFENSGNQVMKENWKGILESLDRSRQLWPVSGTDSETRNLYDILSIPNDASLVSWTKKWLNDTGSETALVESMLQERFAKVLFVSGYAMYNFDDLRKFENEYLRAQNLAGVHLYASKKKDWSQIPSPYFETVWRSGDEGIREKEKKVNNYYRELFDRAIQDKLIQYNGSEEMYHFQTVDNDVVKYEENAADGRKTHRIGDIQKGDRGPSEYKKLAQDMFIHMFSSRDIFAEKYPDIADPRKMAGSGCENGSEEITDTGEGKDK